MASITSVELNYMIFRYLSESGFTHSAFVFGSEAGTNKAQIDGSLVPPHSLVNLVQKGLQYKEMEANLTSTTRTEADADQDFLCLETMDLITKDVHELQALVRGKKGERTVIPKSKDTFVKRKHKRKGQPR